MESTFLKKTAERAVKTFLQFYLGFWLLTMGLMGTSAAVVGPEAFDTLFTLDNVKVGVVGLALSVVTSIGTKNLGPEHDSPSVV
jgi:energy-converting hydrogenase Eha subunit E